MNTFNIFVYVIANIILVFAVTNALDEPITQGACCFGPVQNCTFVINENECDNLTGTFLGIGTVCSATSCEGGCCSPNDGCLEDLSNIVCVSLVEGIFLGPQTTCANNGSLCNATGACCDFDENTACADDIFEVHCNGTFLGEGTKCANDGAACYGSCCHNSGQNCTNDVTELQCTLGLTGEFLGVETSCFATSCEGACCDGVDCTDVVEANCGMGPFLGIGTTCVLSAEECVLVTTGVVTTGVATTGVATTGDFEASSTGENNNNWWIVLLVLAGSFLCLVICAVTLMYLPGRRL